jgi:hypothetical protein
LVAIGTLGVLAEAHNASLLDFELAVQSLKSTTFHMHEEIVATVRKRLRPSPPGGGELPLWMRRPIEVRSSCALTFLDSPEHTPGIDPSLPGSRRAPARVSSWSTRLYAMRSLFQFAARISESKALKALARSSASRRSSPMLT